MKDLKPLNIQEGVRKEIHREIDTLLREFEKYLEDEGYEREGFEEDFEELLIKIQVALEEGFI